jgi:hypothetical protein
MTGALRAQRRLGVAVWQQGSIDKEPDLSNNMEVYGCEIFVSQYCGGVRYRYRGARIQIPSDSAVDHVK